MINPNYITKVDEVGIIKEYENILMENLKASFPGLKVSELEESIHWLVMNTYKNHNIVFNNNYTKEKVETTVLDILHYIEQMQPIITSSGVLFKQHKTTDNPLTRLIVGFLDRRASFKIEMFKFPKGSFEFEKYNLFQLLEKLNANAVYGILGNNTSIFYNIYIAEGITRQGRSYISCSIMLFESLLANNIKFNSLNEIITFITNIVHEKPDRKYDDSLILDRNITVEECFYKICTTIDQMIWVPTEKELVLIWERLVSLDQEDINRLYYKNNLYTFCDLPIVSKLLIKILSLLEEPFMNPNDPPEIIKDDLDALVSLVKEYVYYKYPYIDKLDRIEYMQRDIVCLTDTDSTIISFDGWYRFVLEKIYNKDIPLKRRKFRLYDIFSDNKRKMVEFVQPSFDYDFFTDEVVETHRLMDMYKLIPQDSIRHSIINIIAYICSDLIIDYLNQYCYRSGSTEAGTQCKMIMKNEFLFKRILLTNNKKNYADIQELQEGNIIPDVQSAKLDIKGLAINKSTLSEDTRKKFQDILYEDIMMPQNIDQIKVMKDLILVEKEITRSILNKETKYYKPDNIGSLSSYAKNPLEINGIVASMIYNELRSEDMPMINLEERNKIFKIKLNITKNNIEIIKDSYPEIYNKILKLLNHPTLGSKLNTIAFPLGSKVPDWVLNFVDISTIVNDNLKNFPIDSIGLKRLNNDNVNYSNIISL